MKSRSVRSIVLIMLMAFIIPAFIMVLALYNTEIYPGGTNTILIYDMNAQFLPIYASLRYLGKTDNSLFLSFFGALANNALPNYSTYIVNPLSWITVLFPLSKLPDVLYYLTVLRIGLCGLGFSIYLLYGRKEYREKRYPIAIVILSSCYALMSFNIVYSMCLNWLDIVFLLPLILTSLERLLEGEKGIAFVLVYSYAIYNSFQLSYIMGIFLVLYLAFRLIDKGDKWRIILPKFLIRVALAVGMSMPVFLPMMKAARGRLDAENNAVGGILYFGIREVLGQFFSCKYNNINTGGLPYIFCGTLTLLLVIIYLFRITEGLKKKIVAFCIILFYLISFCVVPINKIWHGFSETMSFPGRYAYTLCCFMIILAYDAIPILEKLVSIPDSIKPFIGGLALCIVMCELYMNSSYILASANLKYRYRLTLAYNSYITQIGEIQKQIDDEDFYRISRGNSGVTYDDGMLFGYNGIAYFSSFYENNFMDFMGLMGFSQNAHVLEDKGATPVMESIFGVKYRMIYGEEEFLNEDVLCQNNPFELTYNKHSLPVGFIMGNSDEMAQSIIRYTSQEDDGNALAYQELLLSDIYGSNCEIYEPIEYELYEINDEDMARHVSIDFIAKDNRPVWVFCKNATEEQLELTGANEDKEDNNGGDSGGDSSVVVNGKEILRLRSKYSTTCTYIGSFDKGEKVHIDAKDEMFFGDPWIVHYDGERCNEILDEIRDNQGMDVIYHRNGVIRGNIIAPFDVSYMMLTLPYMDGYVIKVDGKLVEYEDYRGALVLVKMSKGEHEVEISFIPPGFMLGIVVGVISLICTIVLVVLPFGKAKKNETILTTV